MDIHVLNTNFETIAVIDAYESALWTDRYNEPGECEIYAPVSTDMLTFPVVNNYLRIAGSKHLMIIEDIQINSVVETGNHITIRGRSLESILDRRCIVNELNVSGSLQNSIKSIITSNFISPSDSARRIPNFIFEDSTDSRITSLTYENQYKGVSVLEVIQEMCKDKNIGFQIVLNDSNQFVFSLYIGEDRSYKQDVLPWVVFKPSFENLIRSDYSEENSSAKTFCYIYGSYTERSEESTESEEVEVIRTVGSGSGLLRKEVYREGGITKDEDMSTNDWYAKLDQSGNEELNERKVKKTFESELETTKLFVYGRDFFVGDVVQIANEYGFEAPSRMTEYTWEVSTSGTNNHPTFEALDYEG